MRSSAIYIGLFVVAFVVVTIGMVACGNMANESKARNLVKDTYRDVEYQGRDVFLVTLKGCGKEDVAIFKYKATNINNERVTVEVCQGFPFKGATIRGR